MSLNRYLVRIAPGFLRAYRTRLLLDLPEVLAHLPQEGRILDVGCAVGSTDYTIGRLRPRLDITGIDIDTTLVERANRYNSATNVRYQAWRLEESEGQYDCITLIDLLHHVTDEDARALLGHCPRLLAPGGYVFVKDVDKRGGFVSYFLDRYVTRADPIQMRTPDEIKSLVPGSFAVVSERRKWSFLFPHVYFKLAQDGGAPS